ncbi:MAG: hypothetical protein EOP54_27390 [Sphingobacteriales bacterium]|nr:MAG: hypothetical protein EOP54_27390 [Sphingobacteriales bacterium]
MPVNISAWRELPERFVTASLDTVPVKNGDLSGFLSGIVSRRFSSKKYAKTKGLFNFHSWRPYYEDPLLTYSLYGENILNTMQTEVFYQYNENDKTHSAGASLVYGGFFPYISAGTQYTFNREATAGSRLKQWDQLDNRVGVSIPLSWTKGKSFRQFNAGTNYFYRNDYNKGFYKDSFATVKFSYLHHFLSWSQQAERAPQHIFPRWGYNGQLNYRHAITNYESWQFLASGSIYAPGIIPSHSLVITGAFQETDTLSTLFANRLPYSRGYNAIYAARMWRTSVNYHFPIVYPDWGFGNILYLQRIRANAFYDFTKVYSRNKSITRDQRSVGGEIYIDTKWWNQYALTFGFRVGYLLDTDLVQPNRTIGWEFVLPVSILPR